MDNKPRIGPRQVVYQNQYQQIYQVQADFGAYAKEYFVLDTGEKAGIVVSHQGAVLLVRQYRLLINELSWEIPGGRVDDGEEPAETAIRECLEETGVRCLEPRPLIFYHSGLDTSYNPTHLFYSEEISPINESESIHSEEVVGVEWIALSRCIEMIFERKILDSFSIIALLAYQAQLQGRNPRLGENADG